LTIDPQYVYALNNKGLALDNLGNYTEAILYYDKALAIQSNDTYALDNKAAALDNLGNYTGSILYYNKALAIDPKDTFALTNKDEILHMLGNNSTFSTYENSTYGIRIQYPSDWSVQESNTTGTLIKIATFVSPTGPDSDPTAGVSIYMEKLHNSTTTLNNYAHFVAFTDYENNTNFHAFKLLELSTNSSILAGKPAYTIIGTYQKPPFGLQQLKETGTIIGDKAYSVLYIADAPRSADYLPIVQKMIGSLVIKNSTETDIGTVPDNSTNLHPDMFCHMCYDGLCFVIWTKNR
jgi:tetratricopeptide (TPR) repeat protein